MSAVPESFATAFRLVCPCRYGARPHRGAVARGQRQRVPCSRPGSASPSGAWLAVARFPGQAHRLARCSTPCSPCRRSWSVGRLPAARRARGPLGCVGHSVHADGDGHRADDPDPADHRRARAPGRRRRAGATAAISFARWAPARSPAPMLMLLHDALGGGDGAARSAFGRAHREVGAVMIVGGNIDGVTRVMTTTIALETSKGDLPLALAPGPRAASSWSRSLNVAIALFRRSSGPLAAELAMTVLRASTLIVLREASVAYAARVQAVQRRDDARVAQAISSPSSAVTGASKVSLLRYGVGCVHRGRARWLRPVRCPGAWCFQRPFLLRLSVWNNLASRSGWPSRTCRDRAARRARGTGAAPRRPRRLAPPAGAFAVRQRAATRLPSRAAGRVRPDILFLDELDQPELGPGEEVTSRPLLADFAADGMTLVMSTHNLGQAKRSASRSSAHGRGPRSTSICRRRISSVPRRARSRAVFFVKGELRSLDG